MHPREPGVGRSAPGRRGRDDGGLTVGTGPPVPGQARTNAAGQRSTVCGPGCGQRRWTGGTRGAESQVDDAGELWTACANLVRDQVTEASWHAWLDGLEPVGLDAETLTLAVPSGLAKQRIEERYRELIEQTVSTLAGTRLHVLLMVRTARSEGPGVELPERAEPAALFEAPAEDLSTDRATRPSPERGGHLERYTFETFVIGSSNRFAHAAALAVAERPAHSYNPLFIHGAAGLGKTHLLHAIGNYVRAHFPNLTVQYVSTETFMNQFVEAIRANAGIAFKRRYRECDVLLVDDIHFLENKESLQEEFFHTFNSLYGASKQIVLTSDRPPRAIATLENRLRSRFLSGLITDVQPPELETRLAILRSKAEFDRLAVPDEVLEFIATHVRDNIRELEGALTRVSAFASLNQVAITPALAEEVLADLVAPLSRRISPARILELTAAAFGFTVEDLRGTSRRRPLVTARQVGMYVCREVTDLSYPAIAREFGGRDHTTVIHAVEKIGALMRERRQIYDQVTELLHQVRNVR